MFRNVTVGRQHFYLEEKDVLASGGEAVVFSLPGGRALKAYHNPTTARGLKLQAFLRAGHSLPSNVLYPLELAFNRNSSDIAGFTMRRMDPGCQPIAVLRNKKWSRKEGITTKTVVGIFENIHQVLSLAHGAGDVIGDINDRNEQLSYDAATGKWTVWWIDVDSWQWGNFPCMVGTQEYTSPDLYGVDLEKAPCFKKEHDWFAFTVLLFRSLLGLHPFKVGIHPKYNSLAERAKRGITVLDPDVRYPSIGFSPDVLSDDLISLLLEYLKRKRRDPFPFEALENFGEILIECPSCHLWYAGNRTHCPGCQAKSVMSINVQKILAGCEYEELFAVPGNIIFFKISGSSIYCLVDENSQTFLYKKGRAGSVTKTYLFNTRRGAKFSLFRDNLVVCLDPKKEDAELLVIDIAGPQPKSVLKTTTKALAGGGAIFSCSREYLYRLSGNRVMRGNVFGDSGQLLEREVIQASQGQTWFTVSPNPEGGEILVGFYRIFGELKWFLVRGEGDQSFNRFNVVLPELKRGESLIDFSIKFSGTEVLILRKIRQRGEDSVRIDVVSNDDGKVVHSSIVKVEDAARYDDIHGKIFREGIVVHATDQGIVRETIVKNQTIILPDSKQFIAGGEDLYFFGGDILAVSNNRVFLVKPKKGGKTVK